MPVTGVQSDSPGVNLGAMLPFPAPAVPAEPSPVFLQLMLLLGSETDPETASQTEEEIAYAPVEAADPGQIAEAVIRSMLGHGTSQPEAEMEPKAEGEPHKCAEHKVSQRSEKIPKTKHPQTLAVMPSMAANPVELPLQPQTTGNPQGAESNAPRGVHLGSPMHSQERSSPAAPVAFALRLTPREHAAPQREPSTFASGERPTIENFSFDTESKGFDNDQPKENHEHPHVTKAVIAESQSEPLIEFEAMAPVALQTMASMGGDRLATPSLPEFQAEIQVTRQVDLEPVENAILMKPVTAREIAVRVSAPGESNVDVHVAERGGEVRVAVRTADSSLQVSLQQDLGTLIGRLENAGFHAENLATREVVQMAKREISEHTPLHSAVPTSEATQGFRSHGDSRSPSHEEHGLNSGDSDRRQHQQQQQQRQGSGRQAQWRRILEENE